MRLNVEFRKILHKSFSICIFPCWPTFELPSLSSPFLAALDADCWTANFTWIHADWHFCIWLKRWFFKNDYCNKTTRSSDHATETVVSLSGWQNILANMNLRFVERLALTWTRGIQHGNYSKFKHWTQLNMCISSEYMFIWLENTCVKMLFIYEIT